MVKFEGLGLDHVWLENGFQCLETGHGRALVVDHVEALERSMARHLAGQCARLTGQEFRFLRDMLGLSQLAFGKLFGRDYQTVARWEANAGEPVPHGADAMIRQLTLEHQGGRPLFTRIVEKLAQTTAQPAQPTAVSLRVYDDGSWKATARVAEAAF